MQLRLSYPEIQDLIMKRTGKSLPMSYSSKHTVHISYEVNVMFRSSAIGLDVTVDRISGCDLYLSYSGGAAIEMMVRSALDRAKSMAGSDALEALPGNSLVLHLDRNPQSAQMFDHIVLQDINFDEIHVNIEFSPKA